MILAIWLYIISANSIEQHICVCNAIECEPFCKNENSSFEFLYIEPHNLESVLLRLSTYLWPTPKEYIIHITSITSIIEINLSTLNNLTISFESFFKFSDYGPNDRINIKIIIDQLGNSYSRLRFSNCNLILSSNFDANHFKLDFLSLDSNSNLKFEDPDKRKWIFCKGAELSDLCLLQFDQINIERGYLKPDLKIFGQSLTDLALLIDRYNWNDTDSDNWANPNPILIYNSNHKIIGASNIQIESTNSTNLNIQGYFSENMQSTSKHFTICLNNFNTLHISNCLPDSFYSFNCFNTKNIICNSSFLPLSISNSNFIINSTEISIDGLLENVKFISYNNSRNFIYISQYENLLTVMNSSIDIQINDYKTELQNPFTFCIGKFGISTISITTFNSNAIDTIYLNRDFNAYLSDDEIDSYLHKHFDLLKISKYVRTKPISELIETRYTNNEKIHGFCDIDSVLEIHLKETENYILVDAYLNSPNEKALKLCLSVNNSSTDCFIIENLDIIENIPPQAENVVIEINDDLYLENIIFRSMMVKILTITAKNSGQIGSLTFIEKVSPNITIENLNNYVLKFGNEMNFDNVTILNSICKQQESTHLIQIKNLTTNTQIDFIPEISITQFNLLVEYFQNDINFIQISNDSLITSVYEYNYPSIIPNLSIIYPYSYDHSQNLKNKKLDIFLNSESTPKLDFHIIEPEISIFMNIDQNFNILNNEKFTFYYQPELTVFYSNSLDQIDFIGDPRISFELIFPFQSNFCLAQDKTVCLPSQAIISNNELNEKLASIDNQIVTLLIEGTSLDLIPLIQKSSIKNKFIMISSINKVEKVSFINDIQSIDDELLSSIVFNDMNISISSDVMNFGNVKLNGNSILNSKSRLIFNTLESPISSLKFSNNTSIKNKLILHGEIMETNQIYQFSSNSMMILNLNNSKVKIRFEAKNKVYIEENLFVGVDYIEINICSKKFDYVIENEEGNKKIPKIKLTQNFSKDFQHKREKIRDMSGANPTPNQNTNTLTLLGDWNSIEKDYISFNCLNDVSIYVNDENIPIDFLNTCGDLTFYVSKSETNFFGDIILNDFAHKVNLTFFYLNNDECKINLLGKVGGLTLVNLYLLQNNISVQISNLDFKQPTIEEIKKGHSTLNENYLLVPHLYIDIDGHSQLSILHNGYQLSSSIFLYFYMNCDLIDQKFKNFLNTKERVLIPYIDSVLNDKFTYEWDLIPTTHGLSSCIEIIAKKTNQVCMALTKYPSDIPFEVFVNQNSLHTKEQLNDMTPYLPKGKYPLVINIIDVDEDSIFNFNYDFFDNFSISLNGNQRNIPIELGKNHVSEIEISYLDVAIVDQDYEIKTWHVGASSSLNNVNGVKNLIYSFDNAKMFDNSFEYHGNLTLKTKANKFVFGQNKIVIEDRNIDITKCPNLNLFIEESNEEKVFETEKNLIDVPQIGISFLQDTSIRIGRGWEFIRTNNLFMNVSGVSNIKQIITEIFPLISFNQLTNIDTKIRPDASLMPIKYNSELLLNEDEQIELDLIDLDETKSKINFESNVTMSNNSAIWIHNAKPNSVQIQNLLIEDHSEVFVNSVTISKSLELSNASRIIGNIDFEENSEITINLNMDTILDCADFDINNHFPLFDSELISEKVPNSIKLNIESDIDDFYEIREKIVYSSCSFFQQEFKLIKSGLSCLYWLNSLQINKSQSSLFFQPKCKNGYLILEGYMYSGFGGGDDVTPTEVIPSPNFSSVIHPTFEPNKEDNQSSEKETVVASLIVCIVFIAFIAILAPVIIYLKKKYKQYETNSLETDVNDTDSNL